MIKTVRRLEYMDIAKGIGILLMIIGHASGGYKYSEPFSIYIHSFHMPIFFLISGYLYQNHKDKTMMFIVKKKAMSLMIPYVFFGLGTYVLWLGMQLPEYFKGTQGSGLLSPLKHLLWINSTGLAISGEFWFLSALFIATILFEIVNRYISNTYIHFVIALGLGSIGTLWTDVTHVKLPYSMTSAWVGYGFLYIGHMLNINKKNVVVNRLLNMNIIELIIIFIIFSGSAMLNGSVNMRTGYYQNGILFWINAVILSLCIINLAKKLENANGFNIFNKIKRYFALIGRTSITYVCLNSLYLTIIAVILNEIFNRSINDPVSLVRVVFSVLCTLIGIFYTDKIIRKTRLRVILGIR